MNQVKVTIGIPFYNPGEYFRKSITSILLQTYRDFELILIDDGSTDDSLAIAHSFSDPRVKVYSDNKNLGLPTRLNQIVCLASGEYIARMDADDLVSLSRIEKQVEYLDSNDDIDLVSTGICSITNSGDVMSVRLPSRDRKLDMALEDGINGCTEIAHATIVARKSWYLRNLYDENAKLMEDYQLWIDALIKDDLKVGYIREPLYFYREQSSIRFDKVVSAYRNQKRLIESKYKKKVSFKTRFLFYSRINVKILITRIFSLLGVMNKLIALRNRGTVQTAQLHQLVQTEIRKLNSLEKRL